MTIQADRPTSRGPRRWFAAAGLVVLFVLLATPGSLAAQGWADRLSPDRVRGERLFRRAMEHVACALDAEGCIPDVDSAMLGPEVEWEQALVRLDRALGYMPEDPDLLFFRALALARWERREHGVVVRRVPEATAAFERLRALHPDVAVGTVAFELALLRTRVRDYEGASAEYTRGAAASTLLPALPILAAPRHPLLVIGGLFLAPSPEQIAGNWAEVTMLAGDAEGAIERYLVAIDAEAGAWPNAALARFGLALALDRSGAHDAALDAVRDALDVEAPRSPEDPMSAAARTLIGRFGSFAPLHAEGVFFEPECEMSAYEALGHEALAAQASTAEGRRARLESALGSWRAFLEDGGREGLWAARAEENVARLEAILGR